MKFDKRQSAIEHIRQINFPNRAPADMLVTSWLDGFDYALDLCIMLEERLGQDETDPTPEFSST